MPPRIALGVNLNFAKYVYGPKRAVELVRETFGVRVVEAVPDNDFGPVFFHTAPEAFRSHHREVVDHARRLGVRIDSVLTVYRDTGAIAHPRREIRESAYQVGLALLEMASCYRSRYASSSLFTMNRELAEDPERYQSLFDHSLQIWKRWMVDARRLRLERILIEMAAAYREGCSTIRDTRDVIQILDEHHEHNPDTTVPVGVCYDTGHGISERESPDPRDRDFAAWFDAFPDRIHEIHLKNTDPHFLETWHFGDQEGIIDLHRLLSAIRDTLTVPDVLLLLEVPGKRGREIGEARTIEDHKKTLDLVRQSLRDTGYREQPDGDWIA